ncbi:expressed unknown protein [Seminavis robusta]|uniref:Uncharacterized protein n=1 Tax=Seminavis robusta TaxID=568900 RepID=A0A9N8H2C7_9STRA|nr:expressed unknown protein [Seminavis robusta]|eukprot:Sro7_g005710.1 n/a (169) ;mRNA; f:8179-8685
MCQRNATTCSHNNATTVQLSSCLKFKTQIDSLYEAMREEKKHRTRPQHNVTFGLTEIHTHPRLLDTAREGPSLTIGWEPVSKRVTTVQDHHMECKPSLDTMLPLHPDDRISILCHAGCSTHDMLRHFLYHAELEKIKECKMSGVAASSVYYNKPARKSHRNSKTNAAA